MILEPMATNGAEPIGSMGNDAPIAVLSDMNPPLFQYFKQLFAQVCNPPLDAIREELVTSLETFIGPEKNLFEETAEHCHQLRLKEPFLTNAELAKIRVLNQGSLRSETLSTLFDAAAGEGAMRDAVQRLCEEATKAVDDGASILILSDRGVDQRPRRHPEPARDGCRAPPPDPRGHPHQGRPRRRVRRAARGAPHGRAHRLRRRRDQPVPRPRDASRTYASAARCSSRSTSTRRRRTTSRRCTRACSRSCPRWASRPCRATAAPRSSRPSVSTRTFIDQYFTWTPSRIGGVGIDEIEHETLARHRFAYPVREIARHARAQARRLLPVAS